MGVWRYGVISPKFIWAPVCSCTRWLRPRNLSHISTVKLLYIVKKKGGKPERKPYPLPYGLRNQYRNLKFENSQDYAQKPQCNCTFMNSVSGKEERVSIFTGSKYTASRD